MSAINDPLHAFLFVYRARRRHARVLDGHDPCPFPASPPPAVCDALGDDHTVRQNGVSKRVVIITGYGVHDSTNVQEYQGLDLAQIAPEGEGSAQYELYAGARAEGILAQDSFSQSSMASCKQVICTPHRTYTVSSIVKLSRQLLS